MAGITAGVRAASRPVLRAASRPVWWAVSLPVASRGGRGRSVPRPQQAVRRAGRRYDRPVANTITVRELEIDELPAAWELGRLAFGSSPQPPPQVLAPLAGVTRYGAFDSRGRLIGKANDLHHEQWWAGRRVRAADVGSVAVLPEARGRGVAATLLRHLLAAAAERGAAVSALFPTVAAPYRAGGWEACGVLRTVDLPTMALPRHRPDGRLPVRAGGPGDLAAVAALYQDVARHRCGLLTRQGPPFPELVGVATLPDGVDGLTLVEDGAGRLVGCAAWQRGTGYDAASVLTVVDLLAATAGAARELIGVLAGWSSVAPTVRLRPLAGDAFGAVLPVEIAREYRRQVWMHRPVDVSRAVADRGWPDRVRGAVEFALDDPAAPWNSGGWRLEVSGGRARLDRVPDQPELRLSVRGFALLYTGAATARGVAEAGLLSCPPGTDPAPLDLLGPGQAAQLLDYF